MQPCCTFKRLQLLIMVLSAAAVVTVLMILFYFNYPSIAKDRIIDSMVFKNDTDAMRRFLTTEEIKNLRISFHIYNITNPNEVINSGAKINVQEIGPFVYDEYKVKDLVDNNQTLGLLTYKLKRRYILNTNLTTMDPTKTFITWPNVPLLVAQAVIDKLSFGEKSIAYFMLNLAIKNKSEPAFIIDTVENFIFDGSKREFFAYLQSLDKLKMIKPWPLKDNKFALLYNKNFTWDPSVDHLLTTSAGFGVNQNYENLNQYVYIDGSPKMSIWRNDTGKCNQIGGTDGEFFAPFLNESTELQVFTIDICRKLALKFQHDIEDVNGVPANMYKLDTRSLQSFQNNPENKCYCLSRNSDDSPKMECMLDGLIDLSTCNQPNIVASGAHFMFGSPELLERIDGISAPNASIHEPVLYAEPNTGLTVKVRVPLQFNVRLQKGGFNIFKFFTDDDPLILPLVWAVESSELTVDQASLLRSRLLLLDSWLVTLVLGGAIVFIIMIVILGFVLFTRYKDSRRDTNGREPTENDPLIPN